MKHIIPLLAALALAGCTGAASVGQNPGFIRCSGKSTLMGSVGPAAGLNLVSDCGSGATIQWGAQPPVPPPPAPP